MAGNDVDALRMLAFQFSKSLGYELVACPVEALSSGLVLFIIFQRNRIQEGFRLH